ncbi:MAG: zinc ribbon domain-containing protein [Candidatus Poseidoniales archaeon]|nr:MAG: zinc ribbon domain-containing protein [Candidatus Poseidoniales archaeon]
MGGVYCPTCEAGVEVTAKFCLSCGHDLTAQGPITATGHDLNQLKDVIRIRDDLSMAEKFDMIAKIEDGADPIALGIAAAGDEPETQDTAPTPAATVVAPALREASWESEAADAAIDLAAEGTKLADLKSSGAFEKESKRFAEAMDIGRTATLHLLEVSQGAVLPASEAMQSIPIMQPPNKSFCPKCGSDIHANAMLQWKKWSDMSTEALTIQLEAAMRASLMHISASYRDQIQDLKDQLSDAKKKAEEAAKAAPAPAKEEPKEEKEKKTSEKKGKKAATTTSAPKKAPAKAKPKAGGLFGAKKPKKTYEGEPGGKAEWFLEEALDTVYDPHGTGKPIKAAMILARSSDGNVRVRDVIRAYAVEGEDGVSELAWTSPITKYLIEAYDAC